MVVRYNELICLWTAIQSDYFIPPCSLYHTVVSYSLHKLYYSSAVAEGECGAFGVVEGKKQTKSGIRKASLLAFNHQLLHSSSLHFYIIMMSPLKSFKLVLSNVCSNAKIHTLPLC